MGFIRATLDDTDCATDDKRPNTEYIEHKERMLKVPITNIHLYYIFRPGQILSRFWR